VPGTSGAAAIEFRRLHDRNPPGFPEFRHLTKFRHERESCSWLSMNISSSFMRREKDLIKAALPEKIGPRGASKRSNSSAWDAENHTGEQNQ
jgi:hypothetical protein